MRAIPPPLVSGFSADGHWLSKPGVPNPRAADRYQAMEHLVPVCKEAMKPSKLLHHIEQEPPTTRPPTGPSFTLFKKGWGPLVRTTEST